MKKKSRMKSVTAFCAAMAMAVTGTASISAVYDSNPARTLTATAAETASEEVTISSHKFGLVTPANSVSIRRGSLVVKSLTWDEFTAGFTFKSPADTELVLEYDDGTLVFNAVTGKCISNSRKSGVSREEFYITPETFIPRSGAPWVRNDESLFYVIPLIPDETDNVQAIDCKNYPADNSELKFTADFIHDKELAFEYTENADIYLVCHIGRNVGYEMFKYDPFTGYIEEKASFSNVQYTLPINSKQFPNETGYLKAEAYTAYKDGIECIHAGATQYGIVIDENDNGFADKVIFTEDDLKSGVEVIWRSGSRSMYDPLYIKGYQHHCDITAHCRIKFYYENGDYAEYACLGNDRVYLLNEYRTPSEVQASLTGTGFTNLDDTPIYKATTGKSDKDIMVSNEVLGLDDRDYDYRVMVYKGATVIENLNGKDFQKKVYTIEDYDKSANYYIRVLSADSKDSIFYRFYPEVSGWVKRIDTEVTPLLAKNPLSPIMFTTEYSDCAVAYKGSNVMNCKTEEFAKGNKSFNFVTSECDKYTVTFKGAENEEGESDDAVYTYIGIDAEPLTNAPSETLCSKDKIKRFVVSPANPADNYTIETPVFHIEGETKDGKPIEGDVFPIAKDGTCVIELPEGVYKLIDPETGLYTTLKVGDEKTDDKLPDNIKDNTPIDIAPEKEAVISYLTPTGDVVGTVVAGDADSTKVATKGKVKDNKFDNSPYFSYEITDRIINSVNPEDSEEQTVESGFLTIDKKGNIEYKNIIKGDINLDGEVNVADLVMAQKYILDALGETPFTIDNFIAMDLCSDGRADVFDVVMERKLLVSLMDNSGTATENTETK